MGDEKILIFIPTYNESKNVERLFGQIAELGLDSDILFIDDASPDGTGAILDGLASRLARIHVVHRPGKMGIGSAHSAGIDWAYANGYTTLITMDSDFAHSPAYILNLLEQSRKADIVVASRCLQENSLKDWNLLRKFLTRSGHFLTRTLLKMPYDATGAFRLYKIDKISPEVFKLVHSWGYSFFFESLYILLKNGYSISEISVILPSRVYGESKMRFSDAWKSLELLFHTFLTQAFHPQRYLVDPAVHSIQENKDIHDLQGWDQYWQKEQVTRNILYDFMAGFFRKFIIRPYLNRFIRQSFRPGASLLHAGCGSGQVDVDITREYSVTGLDISINALKIYQKIHRGNFALLHGDILAMNIPDECMDGVYSLGVLEHFSQGQILKILSEFNRVLKPHGLAVIFWPPVNGASVQFLGAWHFLLNNILKKGARLHPQEESLLQSRQQALALAGKTGFKLLQYSFTLRDFFTQVVLVLEKSQDT